MICLLHLPRRTRASVSHISRGIAPHVQLSILRSGDVTQFIFRQVPISSPSQRLLPPLSMKFMTLVLGSVASGAVITSAQPAASTSSAASIGNPSYTMRGEHPHDLICKVSSDSVQDGWYFDTRTNGPHVCFGKFYESDSEWSPTRPKPWSMLKSYRSGGTENVHWKYTDNENDRECLQDWTWYAEDGKQLLAKIEGRTTLDSAKRRWCALPVYRSGGLEGYQRKYCNCSELMLKARERARARARERESERERERITLRNEKWSFDPWCP
jgi:hypothetical protein